MKLAAERLDIALSAPDLLIITVLVTQGFLMSGLPPALSGAVFTTSIALALVLDVLKCTITRWLRMQ